MIVSHFNSLTEGGAATAAQRLHMELIRQGVDSRFFHSGRADEHVAIACHSVARWQSSGWRERLRSTVSYRMHRLDFKRSARSSSSGNEIFTSPRSAVSTTWPPLNLHDGYSARSFDEPHVVHLHWIARFLDYSSFFRSIPTGTPVVWTLHDMNPFTGGCHFTGGCERFRIGCGSCPQLSQPGDQDVSRNSFLEKLGAIKHVDLHIAAPSRWLLDQAKSSLMFRGAKAFHHIPYGMPIDDFYPMDRPEARSRLGLSPDTFVISFGAMDLRNRRKGAQELHEALARIKRFSNVECLVFGGGQFTDHANELPPVRHVGPVQGLLQQRTIYSASDVFVLPSLEDNLPLTGLEAMACGVPVVGFETGGIPDYVRPGETGLMAPTGDSEQLSKCLAELIEDPKWTRNLGLNARALIEREYAGPIEAGRYSNLYQSLTHQSASYRRQAA